MGVKDAAKAKSKFSRLLPYAVAFGLEKEVIEKFGAANTPAPEWWGKPEEKISFDHSHAYSWAGAPSSNVPKETKKTESRIRRLGETAEKPPKGALLKHIKPKLLTFLEVGREVFSKSSPILEEVVEEAATGQKTG